MASGLRSKPYKSYREVLGLKPLGSKSRASATRATTVHKHPSNVVSSQNTGGLDSDTEVDMQGEQDLFDMQQEPGMVEVDTEDEELAELAEEDLSTDQILALAEAEEQRCLLLENQRKEEEELLRRDQECQEAIQRLKAMRSRRQTLEGNLGTGMHAKQPGRTVPAAAVASTSAREGVYNPRDEIPVTRGVAPIGGQEPGECQDSSLFAFQLLESVKQLKEGKTGPFSELMAKAMSDSTQFLTRDRKAESLPNVHFDTERVIGIAHEIPRPGDGVDIKTEHLGEGSDFKLMEDKGRGRKSKVCRLDIVDNGKSSDESLDRQKGGSRRLKSGKTAKPDESGITCVVQYAHEKLDATHVKNRVFNDLSFHFLVAGELELVLQERMKAPERNARLHFLKMLCYHREYVGIEDIRDQYDATFKTIERGQSSWADVKELEAQMHANLTFRATVNARQSEKREGSREGPKENVSGKVRYCMDFNRGTCPFEDHHQGMFNKKEVTKWHICKKCFALDGRPKRFHPETDPMCPCKENQ